MLKIYYRHFGSLDSTNSWALRHLEELEREALTIISATTQTQGRGQYKREWYSSSGNIYASFCFFLKEDHLFPPLTFTYLLALACRECLERYGVECRIKKPNDLIVEGKKIGGILCETQKMQEREGVVIGLGLNVALSPEEVVHISQPATALSLLLETPPSSERLLVEIASRFNAHLALFREKGIAPFLEELERAFIKN